VPEGRVRARSICLKPASRGHAPREAGGFFVDSATIATVLRQDSSSPKGRVRSNEAFTFAIHAACSRRRGRGGGSACRTWHGIRAGGAQARGCRQPFGKQQG